MVPRSPLTGWNKVIHFPLSSVTGPGGLCLVFKIPAPGCTEETASPFCWRNERFEVAGGMRNGTGLKQLYVAPTPHSHKKTPHAAQAE